MESTLFFFCSNLPWSVYSTIGTQIHIHIIFSVALSLSIHFWTIRCYVFNQINWNIFAIAIEMVHSTVSVTQSVLFYVLYLNHLHFRGAILIHSKRCVSYVYVLSLEQLTTAKCLLIEYEMTQNELFIEKNGKEKKKKNLIIFHVQ